MGTLKERAARSVAASPFSSITLDQHHRVHGEREASPVHRDLAELLLVLSGQLVGQHQDRGHQMRRVLETLTISLVISSATLALLDSVSEPVAINWDRFVQGYAGLEQFTPTFELGSARTFQGALDGAPVFLRVRACRTPSAFARLDYDTSAGPAPSVPDIWCVRARQGS
jgi:hypothetical protein